MTTMMSSVHNMILYYHYSSALMHVVFCLFLGRAARDVDLGFQGGLGRVLSALLPEIWIIQHFQRSHRRRLRVTRAAQVDQLFLFNSTMSLPFVPGKAIQLYVYLYSRREGFRMKADDPSHPVPVLYCNAGVTRIPKGEHMSTTSTPIAGQVCFSFPIPPPLP